MFTRADLSALLEANPQPGVSIYLPTHVLGREIRQDPIRLKNLLSTAAERLQHDGMKPADVQALLAPAAQLVEDYPFWQHQDLGLALFLGDGGMRMYKLPISVAEQVSVGPSFQVRPLLPLLAADGAFAILTITADATRLYQASRFAMTQDEGIALPRNLDEVKGDSDYQNPLLGSPVGRPRTGTIDASKAQVHGDSPEEWQKGRLVEYVRRIALAVRDHLAGDPLPLVVVADTEVGGHFQKLDALGAQLAGYVDANPEAMDGTQLHEAAYAVMRPRLDQGRQEAIERFLSLRGSADARAAGEIGQVAKAAYQGQVETLLVAEGKAVRQRFDEATQTLTPAGPEGGDEAAAAGQDLLEMVTAKTLRHGGNVYVLPEEEMPEKLPAAAILRYGT